MYKIFKENESIQRLSDMACIPCDPENTDYQEFLAWADKGNKPELADIPAVKELTDGEVLENTKLKEMAELDPAKLGAWSEKTKDALETLAIAVGAIARKI